MLILELPGTLNPGSATLHERPNRHVSDSLAGVAVAMQKPSGANDCATIEGRRGPGGRSCSQGKSSAGRQKAEALVVDKSLYYMRTFICHLDCVNVRSVSPALIADLYIIIIILITDLH